ncbi:outer membrane exchange accessory lipoprotein TraC [Hyalangium rubrum]|uniref:Outer membrane exchange accessory lipoprotein TraC n=1 Tax=Hyalangium rubrum TaxID=3103134 RepID=A0ABU5HG54_9BACT|nr:outer membrane exchange accessory lipoprotein TraC [Hyalangium sp. s54d21]MDY7232245.1 outer membrane exchange accessory lipoprotein TraC [Hyalangium sp. s54d21]
MFTPVRHRSAGTAPSRRPLALLAVCALLAVSGCTAFGRAVKEGDQLTAEHKWAEAEAAYLRALAADPESSEVTVKLREVRRNWSADVYQEAERAHGAGDLPGAQKLLVRALELDGENAPARALLTQTLDARVEAAQKALKEDRLQDARAEFDAVLSVAPDHVAARKGVDAVQVAWAKRWFKTAQQLEETGKLGNALLAYVRADQERVGATAARERAEAVRQKLRDEVAFLVVATPVEDRAQSPDVAQRLGAGRLASMLPKEVPIRVVTEAPESKVGVKLDLALERVMPLKAVEPFQKTQRYLAGNRSVPNPKRQQYEKQLLQTERTLEEVERKQDGALREYLRRQAELTTVRQAAERCREREKKTCVELIKDCGEAVQELSQSQVGQVPEECNPAGCAASQCGQEEGLLAQNFAAAQQLQKQVEAALEQAELQRREVQRNRDLVFREPLTVDEPMYSDFVYDVEKHRLTVKATVTSVLRDLLSPQAAPAPVTQDYDVSHEDTSNKGYDRYGVLADPVQLRNELELRVEVGDKAMADLAGRVRERFDAYRQKRVEDARRGMVRPGAEDVVETSVRVLLLTADAPPADILLPVTQARGLQRPEALFGK